MARYGKYKNSGVKWLGSIPNHWDIIPLKFIVTCNDACLSPVENADKRIKYVEISDVDSVTGVNNYTEYNLKEAPSRARRITEKNDVIISTVRTYLKAVAKINENDLIVSTGFAVLRSKKIIHSDFLYYLILSDSFVNRVISYSVGTSYPAITTADMLRLKVCVPPLDEQKSISDYLDAKVRKIDEAIKQQQKMIELLNERRQIIISEAVTKGVNPDVPMKDSGIDWVGVIPEHWEVRRLKTLMSVRDERNDNPDEMLLSVYTALGVRPRKELEERGNKASTVINYKKVRRGDLIVNRLLAWMGAYGLSDYQGVTSPDYDVYCFNSTCFNPYYELMFRNSRFKGDCFKYGHGIMLMRWRTYPSEFLNIKVPYPPYDEQVLIYGALRPEIDKISLQIEQREKIIKRLSERKRIIINDVVTGKAKVS